MFYWKHSFLCLYGYKIKCLVSGKHGSHWATCQRRALWASLSDCCIWSVRCFHLIFKLISGKRRRVFVKSKFLSFCLLVVELESALWDGPWLLARCLVTARVWVYVALCADVGVLEKSSTAHLMDPLHYITDWNGWALVVSHLLFSMFSSLISGKLIMPYICIQ